MPVEPVSNTTHGQLIVTTFWGKRSIYHQAVETRLRPALSSRYRHITTTRLTTPNSHKPLAPVIGYTSQRCITRQSTTKLRRSDTSSSIVRISTASVAGVLLLSTGAYLLSRRNYSTSTDAMSSKLIPENPAEVMVIRNVTPNIVTFSVPFSRFGRFKIGGRGTLGESLTENPEYRGRDSWL